MMLWIRKIHKWASLLIGLQLLIWLTSGLVFNVIDHKKARGNAYRQTAMAEQPTLANQALLPVKSILKLYPATLELNQVSILSQPYYLLTQQQGLYRHFANSYHIVNAITDELTLVDETFAKAIAKATYNGPGNIKSVALITPPIADFLKHKNPSWQINFADDLATSVYVEQGSGRLIGHSNSDKRFADFFFMLHFMDYGSAGSFNTIQMILFAFITLWLTLSGLIWTLHLLRKGQYRLKKF
ncbi:PepSY domain-containing protein [Colwellia sp. MB3u-4]|uniref:PepSY domain-containing protein n=1 Tax=Colwellia sp. MB3u-4 TaxID=2759822 RepID=UPI002175446B|nr:PepSY domain-containing protein [Colwellia sp. MB3u-4]